MYLVAFGISILRGIVFIISWNLSLSLDIRLSSFYLSIADIVTFAMLTNKCYLKFVKNKVQNIKKWKGKKITMDVCTRKGGTIY